MSNITIEDYSERAIAVFGDTKPISERLSLIQGSKFNPSLRGIGESKRPGWIFPKTRRAEVESLLQTIQDEMKQGSFKAAVVVNAKPAKSNSSTIDSSLLSRIELLEAKVETLSKSLAALKGSSTSSVKPTSNWADEEEDSEEEKQSVKPKSLLRSVLAKK